MTLTDRLTALAAAVADGHMSQADGEQLVAGLRVVLEALKRATPAEDGR